VEQASSHKIFVRIVSALGNWLYVIKSRTESGELLFAVMTQVSVPFKHFQSILFDFVEIEFLFGIDLR
jgi:hypothetical protein